MSPMKKEEPTLMKTKTLVGGEGEENVSMY